MENYSQPNCWICKDPFQPPPFWTTESVNGMSIAPYPAYTTAQPNDLGTSYVNYYPDYNRFNGNPNVLDLEFSLAGSATGNWRTQEPSYMETQPWSWEPCIPEICGRSSTHCTYSMAQLPNMTVPVQCVANRSVPNQEGGNDENYSFWQFYFERAFASFRVQFGHSWVLCAVLGPPETPSRWMIYQFEDDVPHKCSTCGESAPCISNKINFWHSFDWASKRGQVWFKIYSKECPKCKLPTCVPSWSPNNIEKALNDLSSKFATIYGLRGSTDRHVASPKTIASNGPLT